MPITKKSTKDNSIPRKYTKRRGLARIDVVANKEKIEEWLDKQFCPEAIYLALIESGRIEDKYSYRTFLRALYTLIPKAKRSKYRPSTTREAQLTINQQLNLERKRSVKTMESSASIKHDAGATQNSVKPTNLNSFSNNDSASFAIPTNNITGDDE